MVTNWGPPGIDVSRVGRVAVGPFTGPEDLSEVARSTLRSALTDCDAYELVEPSGAARQGPAGAAGPGPEPDPRTVDTIAWGRRMNADTVLVGQVQALQDSGVSIGSRTFHVGDPAVKAKLTVALVDVHSGRLRYQRDFEQTYSGEFETGERSSGSDPKVLARLVRACAESAAESLCGARRDRKVELAHTWYGDGSAALRRGNKLAGQGDWAGASESWRQALAENSECHHALYNLGLAFESRGDAARARQHYLLAYELQAEDLYRDGLKRVDPSQSDLWQLGLAPTTIPDVSTQMRAGLALLRGGQHRNAGAVNGPSYQEAQRVGASDLYRLPEPGYGLPQTLR